MLCFQVRCKAEKLAPGFLAACNLYCPCPIPCPLPGLPSNWRKSEGRVCQGKHYCCCTLTCQSWEHKTRYRIGHTLLLLSETSVCLTLLVVADESMRWGSSLPLCQIQNQWTYQSQTELLCTTEHNLMAYHVHMVADSCAVVLAYIYIFLHMVALSCQVASILSMSAKRFLLPLYCGIVYSCCEVVL